MSAPIPELASADVEWLLYVLRTDRDATFVVGENRRAVWRVAAFLEGWLYSADKRVTERDVWDRLALFNRLHNDTVFRQQMATALAVRSV